MTALVTLPTKTITLEQGVKLGDNIITEITITKPLVSHLKGVKLAQLMEMQIDEIVKILPRVTQPALTEKSLDSLEFNDFMALCAEVISFLTSQKTATPDE